MDHSSAWTVTKVGQLPSKTGLTLPVPQAGEARIRITATGLNFADLLMIDGTYQETPEIPFALGMECAGVVESVTSAPEGFSTGDRVMCAPMPGLLATHAIVPTSLLRPIPDTMSDTIAAGFQIAYGTSHLALRHRAKIEKGETLLVLGAAGGVGLTAVEVGKQLGARVIAVARGAEKLAIAEAAGADALVDSTASDLLEQFRALGPIHVVYDAVGGEIGEAALRSMAPEGRFLVIGFASGSLPRIKPNHLLVKNQTVIGLYWGGYNAFRPEVLSESLMELAKWHGEGRLSPHISHTLPYDQALEGLDLLKTRKATGKIVITQ